MWPIFVGGFILSALAYAALGGRKTAPAPVDVPDEPDAPGEPDDEPDEPDEPDAPVDEPDEPDDIPGPDDYDDAVFINVDARRAQKRRARVPKVRA